MTWGMNRRHLDLRQAYDERRAAPRSVAARLDDAAVLLDEALDERQSYPEATLTPIERPFSLPEQIEDPWQEIGGNSNACIFHAQDGVTMIRLDSDAQRPARRCVLDGVRQKVCNHLI